MKTVYSFINSSEISETVDIHPLKTNALLTVHLNGEELCINIKEKPFTMDVRPGDDVELILNTEDAFVKINKHTTLRSVNGPIEYTNSLDKYFSGCVGLVDVSDNVFFRNDHIKELNETFRDCVMFSPKNFNFLKPLVYLEVLQGTFANTDFNFLNKSMFDNFPNEVSKSFIRTFENCIELSTIAINTLEGLNIKKLDNTFSGCRYIKSIHEEFFTKLSKGLEMIETFSNTGITKIDPNLRSYFPEYCIEKDIFKNCNVNQINQYK